MVLMSATAGENLSPAELCRRLVRVDAAGELDASSSIHDLLPRRTVGAAVNRSWLPLRRTTARGYGESAQYANIHARTCRKLDFPINCPLSSLNLLIGRGPGCTRDGAEGTPPLLVNRSRGDHHGDI